MKNHWLAALLSIVFVFVVTGCGTPRGVGGNKKRQWGTTQTGTNIPRWTTGSDAGAEPSSKQRTAKAKREKRQAKKHKTEKPKRERQERRTRPADEEVITRGGFR